MKLKCRHRKTKAMTKILLSQAEMPVLELIEDELLLALPMAPRHADDSCAITGGEAETNAFKKPNPFARLEALKSK